MYMRFQRSDIPVFRITMTIAATIRSTGITDRMFPAGVPTTPSADIAVASMGNATDVITTTATSANITV